jgi:hypothetical protein
MRPPGAFRKQAHASGRIVHADYDEWGRADREASLLDGVVQRLAAQFAVHPEYKESWKS